MYKTAIIIVNWNSAPWLAKSVESALLQAEPAHRIVVIDNGSTDDSIGSLKRFHAPHLDIVQLGKNIGFAAANNVGFDRSRDCQWVALLNPDAYADPAWLKNLLASARNQAEYQFFASRQVMANDLRYLDGAGDTYHVSGLHWRSGYRAPVEERQQPAEVFTACAAAALYRTDVVRECGGFDERYFCYAEDVDLGFRLRLRGYRCLYVPDAIVHHAGSATTGRGSDFTVYHGHRNLVWTYVKNMPWPLFWLYLPQHIVLNIASLLWFSLRGRGNVVWRAKWDAIKGLRQIWRQRRDVQKGRRVGALEIRRMMATGWLTPYVHILRKV